MIERNGHLCSFITKESAYFWKFPLTFSIIRTIAFSQTTLKEIYCGSVTFKDLPLSLTGQKFLIHSSSSAKNTIVSVGFFL